MPAASSPCAGQGWSRAGKVSQTRTSYEAPSTPGGMYGLYAGYCDGIGVRRCCARTDKEDTDEQNERYREARCSVALQEHHAGDCGAAEYSCPAHR